MWEISWPMLRYHSGTCAEELRNTTNHHHRNSRYPARIRTGQIPNTCYCWNQLVPPPNQVHCRIQIRYTVEFTKHFYSFATGRQEGTRYHATMSHRQITNARNRYTAAQTLYFKSASYTSESWNGHKEQWKLQFVPHNTPPLQTLAS